jgi:ABC-type dipeptide/oligopeptide/nickel transport system permease subunit
MYTIGNGSFLDYLHHLIGPAMVLALVTVAIWSRYMRSSMLEVTNQDFVRTAIAKGLPRRVVIVRHALRNALLPYDHAGRFTAPDIAGRRTGDGDCVHLAGHGRLFLDSIGYRDYPVVMGLLMFTALLVLIGNLAADLLYAVYDPASASTEAALPIAAPRPCWPGPSTVLRGIALALIGSCTILFLVLASAFGPYLNPYDDLHIDIVHRFTAPFSGPHLLGTDQLGRDMLARLEKAGRISLTVGFAAMVLSIAAGTIIGVVAGYYGGIIGAALMRFVDAVLCFPSIFLLLALAAFIEPTLFTITVIIAATAWMEVARLVERRSARCAIAISLLLRWRSVRPTT